MSDVYGANLYNRYLRSAQQKQVEAGVKRSPPAAGPQGELRENCEGSVESCESILVCTGVYRHGARQGRAAGTVFHGHRDCAWDPSLGEAAYIVPDVNDAVQLAFEKEGWS